MTSKSPPDNAAHSPNPALSLSREFREIGWFPKSYATIVGGPSVLALLQAHGVGFQLSDALKWITDGYAALTAEIARRVEPIFLPGVDWLNKLLGLKLILLPHWRPIFLLGMIPIIAFLRVPLRAMADDPDLPVPASARLAKLLIIFLMTVFILVGALAAGLIVSSSAWWSPGLVVLASLSPFFLFILITLPAEIARASSKKGANRSQELAGIIGSLVGTQVLLFGVATAISHYFGISASAAVLTFALIVLGIGVFAITEGRNSRASVRVGMTTLGGFVVAGLIMAVDMVLKFFK